MIARSLAAWAALAVLSAALAGEEPRQYSGIYPHLAVSNQGNSECGIGAVVAWAGKLWFITYPAHQPQGSDDKLYEVDASLVRHVRPESVGGTHANRMIHRESNQLIIGPYFIDAAGRVRVIAPTAMPGRLTAVVRHLTDPANQVYFVTMEEGIYEVDVHTLAVKTLHPDGNGPKASNLLPGDHGKGAYSGQGCLVVTNNGRGGVLAEWNGQADPARSSSWTIVDRAKYTDVTGPGGLTGARTADEPLWALGWDAKSVLLNVRHQGKWTRFRLPKASYTHDADHGWFTEWPRIRDIGQTDLLLTMHGMLYQFPRQFRPDRAAGIRPVATHLKMIVDATEWNGRLVMAADDGSKFGNPLQGRPQSNLWFTSPAGLRQLGPPTAFGGVWVREAVRAGQPSEPFLLAGSQGFHDRVVHLAHEEDAPRTFTLEVSSWETATWKELACVSVPARGYVFFSVPRSVDGEWIRVTTDRDAARATAYFHYTSPARDAEESLFASLPRAGAAEPRSEGLLRTTNSSDLSFEFAASMLDGSGKVVDRARYVIGADLKLRRTDDAQAEKVLRKQAAAKQEFTVDAASVVMTDAKGRRYRLPKGSPAFDIPSASGPRRTVREVVTERNLMNVHGTFYELPRAESGGLAKIRPIATHNREIFDFASWRGMLAISGNRVARATMATTWPPTTAKWASGSATSTTSGNSGLRRAKAAPGARPPCAPASPRIPT